MASIVTASYHESKVATEMSVLSEKKRLDLANIHSPPRAKTRSYLYIRGV